MLASPASCAHISAAKESTATCKLIIGTEVTLETDRSSCCSPPTAQATAHVRAHHAGAHARSQRAATRLTPRRPRRRPAGLPRAARARMRQPDLEHARWLAAAFSGRAWIAAELVCGPDDRGSLSRLRELAQAAGCRWSPPATCTCTCARAGRCRTCSPRSAWACRVAQCGRRAASQRRAPPALARCASRSSIRPSCSPRPLRIAERCNFDLDELRYEYPAELVPAGRNAGELPARADRGRARATASRQGARRSVRELVEHELELIAELRYEPFFLTVHDIVAFARSKDILCQGRGSAANSAVCYCLRHHRGRSRRA